MLTKDLVPARFHESDSIWLRSFSLQDVKCLVVCRGPVRREAFEVFDAIGVREYGMLLSEKDSIVYPRCLAPELRSLRFPGNIHRVRDYMGSGQEEKSARIREIIAIARNGERGLAETSEAATSEAVDTEQEHAGSDTPEASPEIPEESTDA